MTTERATRRGIILSADDYAIAPGVSRAICALAWRGRLSATSCMTVSRFWPEHAGWLRPFADNVDVGLHLTLTDQEPLRPLPQTAASGRFPSLATLMLWAFSRRLRAEEIRAELERQIDAFETAMGRRPAFLDGHQHVHQLPVIRDVVIALWKERYAGAGVGIRVCDEPLAAIRARRCHVAAASAISLLGRGLRRAVVKHRVLANQGFSGAHDFRLRRPYRALFAKFVENTGSRPLVMCHPGIADADLAAADRVTTPREAEYAYFMSGEFAADLDRLGLRLVRWDGRLVTAPAEQRTSSASG